MSKMMMMYDVVYIYEEADVKFVLNNFSEEFSQCLESEEECRSPVKITYTPLKKVRETSRGSVSVEMSSEFKKVFQHAHNFKRLS